MRRHQWRFHIFSYDDTGRITGQWDADFWPAVLDRLAWYRTQSPVALRTRRVFDINMDRLGKHQRV